MAKKKTVSMNPPAGTSQVPVDIGEGTATTTPYTVGTWAGKTQYRCVLCAFDTLDEDAIFAHIETHRLGTPPPTPPQIQSTDLERGEEVEEVFEVELEEVSSTIDEQGKEHKTFTLKE
jgi:hypothetical protein